MNPRKILAAAGALAPAASCSRPASRRQPSRASSSRGCVDPILEPPARPDLVLTATAAPGLRFVGASITYTLVVRNDGDASASNASVTTTLPAGLDARLGEGRTTATAPPRRRSPAHSARWEAVRAAATIVAKTTASGALTSRFRPARPASTRTSRTTGRGHGVHPLAAPPPAVRHAPARRGTPTADPLRRSGRPPSGGTTPEPPADQPTPLLRPRRAASRSILPFQPFPGSGEGTQPFGDETSKMSSGKKTAKPKRKLAKRASSRCTITGSSSADRLGATSARDVICARRERPLHRPRRQRRPPWRRRQRSSRRRPRQGLARRRARQGRRRPRRRRPRLGIERAN